MKIGFIGLPGSGKTTLFNALTGSRAPVKSYAGGGKAEPNLAVVEVGDDRVRKLSAMFRPRKTIFARIEIVDFAGVEGKRAEGCGAFEAQLPAMKNLDAFAVILRNFPDHTGPAGPLEDLERIEEEFIFSDLIQIERLLERMEWNRQRGKAAQSQPADEKRLLKIKESLENGVAIRDMGLAGEEEKATRGFNLLSKIPMMVVLNSAEENFGKNPEILQKIRAKRRVVEFAGKFEMELTELESEDEALLFMKEMGIPGSARDRLTRCAFDCLGLISFFTVGEDEVRAWSLKSGSSAVEAAAEIHSDLARGFIRAECYTFDDISELGSEKAVREKGRMRLEGKEYVVKDGDVLTIRFSV